MPYLCNFCGSSLSTKSNLIAHQKKTIKCLEIQHAGTKTITELEKETRNHCCENCDLKFATKRDLSRHGSVCKSRDKAEQIKGLTSRIIELESSTQVLSKELELAREQIMKLEDQLVKERQNQQIAMLAAISKPTTSVKNTIKNCTIQNLTPLVEDEMRGQLDNLTIDHVKAGPAGYAKYAMDYPLKDKITCTDSSRRKLAWKDAEGVVVYDADGARLSEKFFRVLREKNQRFFREIVNSLGDQLEEAYARGDQVEADTIVEFTDKICTWRREATETSRGKDTELRKDFVKYLCSST